MVSLKMYMIHNEILQGIGFEEIPRDSRINGFSDTLVFFPPKKAIEAITSKHLLPSQPQALITRGGVIKYNGDQLSRREYDPPIFYRVVRLDISKRCFQTLREHDGKTEILEIEGSGYDYDLSTGKVWALRDDIRTHISGIV